jgi:hypothetical protein
LSVTAERTRRKASGILKKEVQRHCEIELIGATVNYTGLLRWRIQSNLTHATP